ncbi:MAG: photosystem II stability/assembly factor-like uncharacterized protein [Limisphaerales bacterium]|jgi:photosystem II stability/assembly factor-like uncharacterized protein
MKRVPFVLFTGLIIIALAGILVPKSVLHPKQKEGLNKEEESQEQSQEESRIPGAYTALETWNAQRAYPGLNISGPEFTKAWELKKEQQLTKSLLRADGTTLPWEPIGPHNTAGRTLTVEFNPQNPNTIWAGSASGGIWLSHTEGLGESAWKRIETGFPELGVMSINFAPNDSNIIYVGTGEVYNVEAAGTGGAYRSTRGTYGIGILKSIDGGITWSKSLDWTTDMGRGVNQVRIDPHNVSRVYAASTEGLLQSTDAGLTWSTIFNEVQVTDILVHDADPNILLLACGNLGSPGRGLYRSDNMGLTWAKISFGVPSDFLGKIMLAKAPSNPDIMYASFGNGFSSTDGATWLCKSINGGATWAIINTTDYSLWQGWFAHDVAVHPDDENELITVGIQVWRSTNGGNTLSLVTTGGLTLGTPPIDGPDGGSTYMHSDIHDVTYHPANPDIVYLAVDGGVFRSENRGINWRSVNGGLQTTQFYNGTSSSFQDSLFYMGGLQDNSTVIWTGTNAWSRNVGGDGSYTAINPDNDQNIFLSWQYLNLCRSYDQGAYFDCGIGPVGFSNPVFIAPFGIALSNPDVMYAAADRIYKSTNNSGTWTPGPALDFNPVLSLGISPSDDEIIYAATAPLGTRGHVFVSINGNLTYTDITGSLPDRYFTDLAVDPVQPSQAYITLSGFGSGHVYRTDNFGLNWTDISASLPDVPHNAIAIDPDIPSNIYVGNDLGVWFSEDTGATWTVWSEGLFEAQIIMDLNVSTVDRRLRGATHGNGAWQRKMEGNVAPPPPPPSGIVDINKALKFEATPNPFYNELKLNMELAIASDVTVSIYNINGQLVKTWPKVEIPTGQFTIQWDGKNDQGGEVAPGIFLVNVQTENGNYSSRIIKQ